MKISNHSVLNKISLGKNLLNVREHDDWKVSKSHRGIEATKTALIQKRCIFE